MLTDHWQSQNRAVLHVVASSDYRDDYLQHLIVLK